MPGVRNKNRRKVFERVKMYLVSGSEDLYLLKLKVPKITKHIIYTLSIDYERIIFHDKSPILFKDEKKAPDALKRTTCGAEKLVNANIIDSYYTYDFGATIDDLLDCNQQSEKDNSLSACIDFLLDFCRDTLEIPKDLFVLHPVYSDPEKARKYKHKKTIKQNIPSSYMYYKLLFEASEYFCFYKNYNEYCNKCKCDRKDLGQAINTVLDMFFDSALWI